MDVPEAAPERADSRRKRLRLLKAATDAVAEHGIDVAVADIAARAEVGVGTLYRRFGSKEALVESVLITGSSDLAAELTAALAISDPAERLRTFMIAVAEAQMASRGLVDLAGAYRRYESPELRHWVVVLRHATEEVTRLSQRAGVVRSDVTWRDLVILARAIVTQTPSLGIEADADQWRRTLVVILDGLRPPGFHAMPGRPPTDGKYSQVG